MESHCHKILSEKSNKVLAEKEVKYLSNQSNPLNKPTNPTPVSYLFHQSMNRPENLNRKVLHPLQNENSSIQILEHTLHSNNSYNSNNNISNNISNPVHSTDSISELQSISSLSFVSSGSISKSVQILHPISTFIDHNTLFSNQTHNHRHNLYIPMYIPGVGTVSRDGNHVIEQRSLHELIKRIDNNAKANLSIPSYVPSIEHILQNPENISWNKKTSRHKSMYKDRSEYRNRRKKYYLRKSGVETVQMDNDHPVVLLSQDSSYEDEECLTAPKTRVSSYSDQLQPVPMRKQYSSHSLQSQTSSMTTNAVDDYKSVPNSSIIHSINHGKEYNIMSSNDSIESMNSYSQSSLPIDIIGCHHPIQLILYKANERARRIVSTQSKHQINVLKHKEMVDMIAKERLNRLEKKTEKDKQALRARAWLQIIPLLKHIRNSLHNPKYIEEIEYLRYMKKYLQSAKVIVNALTRWYYRVCHRRYFMDLRKLRTKSSGGIIATIVLFKLQFRIFRKRKAVRRLNFFLQAVIGRKKMTWLIHRYLIAVYKVQKVIRSYLICKRNRLQTIAMLWDRLEKRFVKTVMKRQEILNSNANSPRISKSILSLPTQLSMPTSYSSKAVIPITSIVNSNQDNRIPTNAVIDRHLKIAFENQEKRWHNIHKKMNETVSTQKANGNLRFKTKLEIMTEYLLPIHLKKILIKILLSGIRTEYYLYRNAAYQRRIDRRKADFREEDAHDLLRGREEMIRILIEEKVDSNKLARFKCDPFILYSKINHAKFLKRIVAAHYKHHTAISKLIDFQQHIFGPIILNIGQLTVQPNLNPSLSPTKSVTIGLPNTNVDMLSNTSDSSLRYGIGFGHKKGASICGVNVVISSRDNHEMFYGI